MCKYAPADFLFFKSIRHIEISDTCLHRQRMMALWDRQDLPIE